MLGEFSWRVSPVMGMMEMVACARRKFWVVGARKAKVGEERIFGCVEG
jgi:hypothetical protein